MKPKLLAFEIVWDGITGFFAAPDASRAKIAAARQISEHWNCSVGAALCGLRCKRAPALDSAAGSLEQVSAIPPPTKVDDEAAR